MKKLIILSIVAVGLGCSDVYPNNGGTFVVVAADIYTKGLSKFRTKSLKGFSDFSFTDSSNKYSVGDTIQLSKK